MAELDLASMYAVVQRIVHSDCSVTDGMRSVIAECERRAPHPDWKRFLSIDFDSDVAHLRAWLGRVFSSPPSPELTGLWFGLFNPCEDNGEAICDLRVHADVYDPDDEWAGYGRWRPEADAFSSALASIYRIAYREDRSDRLRNDAEYPLCLAYAGLAIRVLLSEPDARKILGAADARVAVVGFDSGDEVLIGTLRKDGFVVARDS